MSENLVFCSVAPPISREVRAFGLLVPATTTTSWPGFSSLALTVWAARSVLGRNNNNKKNPYNYNRDSALRARTPNNNNNKKNPYNYNRDSALRARTPNNNNKKNPYNYNRDSALRARTPNNNNTNSERWNQNRDDNRWAPANEIAVLRISSADYRKTWQFLKAEKSKRNSYFPVIMTGKYNKEYRLRVECHFCIYVRLSLALTSDGESCA